MTEPFCEKASPKTELSEKEYANECGVVVEKLDEQFLENLIFMVRDEVMLETILRLYKLAVTGYDLTVVDGVRGKR